MLFTLGLQFCLMLVGQLDENVFEARSQWTNFGDGNVLLLKPLTKIIETQAVFNQGMDRLTEDRGAANARKLSCGAQSASDFGRSDFDAHRSRRLDFRKLAKSIRRAVGDELAVVDVGDMAATLGFVHVMSRDKKSDALRGEFEEKIPQLTARDGIYAGGRLVEEEQFWFMEHRAAEREALLPSAGELSRETRGIRTEPVCVDDLFDAAFQALGGKTINSTVEREIFENRQIVIKTEILGHVADALADFLRTCANVQPFHECVSAAERKQAGQHFDYGRFAAAIRTEKAENFTFFHAETDAVDRDKIAELANQIFGNDGGAVCGSGEVTHCNNLTSAAMPGRTRCEGSLMRTFTPKTWWTRSSRVCTLRGKNSAC